MGIDSWTTSFIRVKDEKKKSFWYGKKALESDGDPLLSSLNKALDSDDDPLIDGLISSYEDKEVEFDKQGDEDEDEENVVCVTSAASYLGVAIVKQLLAMGYSVCALLDKPDDEERLREMGIIRGGEGGKVEMRWVSLTESDGIGEGSCLYDAFNGCRAVFHTSSFIDPSALSGYSKSMAELEVKAAVNVIKTCSITPSITKCVLTSSLASCIWQDDVGPTRLIDHNSWSQDTTCIDKKGNNCRIRIIIAYLLTKAIDNENCTALVCPWQAEGRKGGVEYRTRNPSKARYSLSSFGHWPWISPQESHTDNCLSQGCQEMYEKGVLATIDVTGLAKAHVKVYEANVGGRFICFDRVVRSEDEARRLSRESGVMIRGDGVTTRMQYQLSNEKMKKILVSRLNRCFTDIH